MKSRANWDLGVATGRRRSLLSIAPFTLAFLTACAAAPEGSSESDVTNSNEPALRSGAAEDGLADAYLTFVQDFANANLDSEFRMGLGHHPGLSTERVVGPDDRLLVSGQVVLSVNTGWVRANLENVPEGMNFDLWFVKNAPGGTVAPEAGDTLRKVGRFKGEGSSRTLEVSLGFEIAFDLDLAVVTRSGRKPTESRVVVANRTLLEKRLFRFRRGEGLDPVTGQLANNIETTDPLVARGAQLFFNETFGGNGRTCGTCHRAENNLTIDPKFIATLPQSDPLFVAENDPALAKLENPQLLRSRGLILENLDGFEDPTNKFVMRSVNHTLSLGLTNGIGSAFGSPPDHRLGWGGDGGPGRSTLHEFTFGAIIQHFTKTLARRPGVDFRIPTQEELDALEAFQLFTGRQKPIAFDSRFPTDEHAAAGHSLFFGAGCTLCHTDLSQFGGGFGGNFDTGVANLTPDLPVDDGFGSPGGNTFNVPPLVEAADTGPFFHNNAVATIEEAVGFYFSATFQASPSSFFVRADLSVEQQGEIAAFLRVVNSFANLAQVRKRLEYVKNVRSPGNTDILNVALADTRDARVVLADKDLNADVRAQLSKAEALIRSAHADKDKNRPAAMKKALNWLDKASAALFTDVRPDPGPGGGPGGKPGEEPSMGGRSPIPGAGGTAEPSMGGRSPIPGAGGTASAGGPRTPPSEEGGSGGGGSI